MILHLLDGREGYGVATVVLQICRHIPSVKFVFLCDGELVGKIPSDRIVRVGTATARVKVGNSTLAGVFFVIRALVGWWREAGLVSAALPSERILIHCHSIYTVLVAFITKIRCRQKIEVLFHFHSTMNSGRLAGLFPKLQRAFVGNVCAGLVAVSKAVAKYWEQLRCPVWVVYNGVPQRRGEPRPDWFLKRDDVLDVFLAGSLSEEKGHLVAVEAFRLLGDKAPSFHLWLAGGPINEELNPFVAKLQSKIKEYELEFNVTLLGFVPGVEKALPYAWVSLQQRITPEPCAMWVLESMAAGIPVIASSTGGTPELVRDGVEGLLVPQNSPESVAKALLRLKSDAVLYQRLSQNSLARSSAFTVEAFIGNLTHVYGELGYLAH
jgi:glycosyltransferase involved in cell wall biosynthesis